AFNHTPWGWVSWGLNWLTQGVSLDHSSYSSHSTTVANWGFPRGGYFAYSGRGGAPVHRDFGGYGRSFEGNRGFGRSEQYVANRFEGFSRGGQGYRPAGEAYNRLSAATSRGSAYSRPESRLAYGPEVYNGTGRGFANRAEATPYRAPSSMYQRNDFGRGSYNSFRSPEPSSFRAQEPKSGGFHVFGHGNSEPKMASRESFGGGHSFGGGGFFGGGKAPKAPKMSGGGGFGGHSSG